MKACLIPASELEGLSQDRSAWRSAISAGTRRFDENRILGFMLEEKGANYAEKRLPLPMPSRVLSVDERLQRKFDSTAILGPS